MVSAFLAPLPIVGVHRGYAVTARCALRCAHSGAAPNGTSNGTSNGMSNDADIGTASATVEATTRAVPPAEIKFELYSLASTTNRGFTATPPQRSRILSLVSELESAMPAENAVDSSLLPGRWRLLFTDALDVLSLGLLGTLCTIGDIYQNIYETPEEEQKGYEFEIENVVQVQPIIASVSNAFFGENVGELKVKAKGKRRNEKRIDITFVSSAWRVVKVLGMDFPTQIPPLQVRFLNPVGFIDTTVLDEDLRVARSPPNTGRGEGNVFVLVREQ